MNLNDYMKSWKGAIEGNKFSKQVIFLLLISNVVLGIALSSKERTVVMVPPHLDQEAWVAKQEASMSMKESWATYVATMLGNVTPRSVNALGPMLGKIVHPGAYKEVMASIAALGKEVETEQLEIQFSPSGVFYVPSKDVVAVSGEFRMRSARGNEKKFVRTYLIGVGVRNYTPSVKSIEILEGPYKPGVVAESEEPKA